MKRDAFAILERFSVRAPFSISKILLQILPQSAALLKSFALRLRRSSSVPAISFHRSQLYVYRYSNAINSTSIIRCSVLIEFSLVSLCTH